MPDPKIDVAGLRGLLEKATKGPWDARFRFGQRTTVGGRQRFPICDTGTAPRAQANVPREEANAALIAAAVNALSPLLDRLERAERELAVHREKPQNAIGAAESDVGRFVYRRIEKLMDAKPGSPAAHELRYLAHIVNDVEEYGATGAEDRDWEPLQ